MLLGLHNLICVTSHPPFFVIWLNSMHNEDLSLISDYLATQSSNACYRLVSRHEHAVFGMCYKVLRNREEAEEAAQDSFLKFFQSLPKLRDHKKFKSWLLSTAYRTAIDLYRRRKVSTSSVEDIHETSAIEDRDPSMILQTKKSNELIQQVFCSMGEQDATILTLYYQEDRPVKEIAVLLGQSESNVKIRLMRTRETLRQKLQPLYENQLSN